MLPSKLIFTFKNTVADYSLNLLSTLKPMKSVASTSLFIIFLFGCSAAPMPTVAKDAALSTANKSLAANDTHLEKKTDCYSKNTLGAKEECLALDQLSECNKDDLRCDPYKKMYFSDKKMHMLLAQIETVTAQVYARYLIDDPEYVNDAILQSRNSNESWKKYRDSYCLSEQYSSGMSRHEIADIAELCRVKKTEERITELDELLVAIKSNREQ